MNTNNKIKKHLPLLSDFFYIFTFCYIKVVLKAMQAFGNLSAKYFPTHISHLVQVGLARKYCYRLWTGILARSNGLKLKHLNDGVVWITCGLL